MSFESILGEMEKAADGLERDLTRCIKLWGHDDPERCVKEVDRLVLPFVERYKQLEAQGEKEKQAMGVRIEALQRRFDRFVGE